MKTWFKNALLLLPDPLRAEPGCLCVEDDVITSVGEAVPQPDRTIDCGGDLLMPGFVNTHTHLPMTLFRGHADDLPLDRWLTTRIYPMEDRLTAEDCYQATLLAAAESIRFGVTTVNDMYMFSDAIARALLDSGLNAMLARSVVSFGGDEARIQEAVSLYETYNGAGGRLRVAFSPHAEYTCTVETLSRIQAIAARLGAPIHIHVSETEKEHLECKARHNGKTPVQLLDSLGMLTNTSLLAHCVHLEEADACLLAQRGAFVLHCPKSNLKLGSGVMPYTAYRKAGVRIALGTDGAASNNSLSMLSELQMAALLHKGISRDAGALPADEAIRLATENGAQALGLRTGRLEAGWRADLILVHTAQPHWQPFSCLPHLAYSAMSGDVRMTMAGGTLLYQDGEFYTIDMEKTRYETRKTLRRICGVL